MKRILYCLTIFLCACWLPIQAYLIRDATAADAPALLTLWQAVVTTTDSLASITRDEITLDWVNDILKATVENQTIFVAENEDKSLVGAIWGQKPKLRSLAHCLVSTIFFVHPDHQNKGLGKQLITYALANIKQSHPEITRIELGVMASNTAALNLYSSLGFKIEGRREQKVAKADGTFETEILMALLNPANS
ncbi:GNAT family N-acetyltransferase [Candidatus Babeliales bacterium]|nr:GNAT family N-acetyltransferase [Candidatus Babeliales bacterium]